MNRLAPPGMGEMPPGAGIPGVPLSMQTQHMGAPVPPAGMAAQSQEAQSAAEFTHCELICNILVIRELHGQPLFLIAVCTTFGDCIEALPPTLTRSISDLRELDAVLSGSISTITDQLNDLLKMLEDPKVLPEQRFHQLRRLADEAKEFRLGGEDKIRVATGTCETVSSISDLARSYVRLLLSYKLILVSAFSQPSSSTTQTSSTCSRAYCQLCYRTPWQAQYHHHHGHMAIQSSFLRKHQHLAPHTASQISSLRISRMAATQRCITTRPLSAIPTITAHIQLDTPMSMLMLRIASGTTSVTVRICQMRTASSSMSKDNGKTHLSRLLRDPETPIQLLIYLHLNTSIEVESQLPIPMRPSTLPISLPTEVLPPARTTFTQLKLWRWVLPQVHRDL